tara:strand:- start:3283 stop:3447 length:165 start_codon:yes stop_codon:yes gene_type:complete
MVKKPTEKTEAAIIVDPTPVVVEEEAVNPMMSVAIIVAVIAAIGWMIYKKYYKK